MANTSSTNVPRRWAQHWFTWVPAGVFAIIGGIVSLVYAFKVLAGILGLIAYRNGETTLPVVYLSPVWVLIDGVILLIVGSLTWGYANRFLAGYRRIWELDSHKLNARYDGIAVSNEELHFYRISEVAIYQGLWGRVFGYGSLTLTLHGRDGKWRIPNAPNPDALRDYFSSIADENRKHLPPRS